ncbi:hypothetical protein SAMN05446635_5545 [Burkholderia sp. OK233]|nr:hypothetical protein SAMN05446635_5545 [Burkholderia sp. OK233]
MLPCGRDRMRRLQGWSLLLSVLTERWVLPRRYANAAQALAESGYTFTVGSGQVDVHSLPCCGEVIKTA